MQAISTDTLPKARAEQKHSVGMGGGRKNLKRAMEDKSFILQEGQSIMQVVDLRGSNVIEVMDANGVKSLALFPAKFQKSIWIKRGSFVVIDGTGREEASEYGSKVSCIVTQVLFHEQIRVLKKSPDWPEVFKSATLAYPAESSQAVTSQLGEDENSSDEDGLPPLEANTNRTRGYHSHSDTDVESGSDSGS